MCSSSSEGVQPGAGGAGGYTLQAKAAVTLELGLAEPLVEGGVVGEGAVLLAVVDQVGGQTYGVGGLDIEDVSDSSAGVADRSLHSAVWADGGCACEFEAEDVEIDFGAEVDAAFANRHADSLESEFAVLLGVADDDGHAVAPDQFVQSHIFEVSTVGEVDEGGGVVDHAEEFGDEIEEAEPG